MSQYSKHYSKNEAESLLPLVKGWLEKLRTARSEMSKAEDRVSQISRGGHDVGGNSVHDLMRAFADAKMVSREFERREIQVKDLDRGLLDFPAYVAGREVYLCWEEGEESIEHWHDLDAGFAGREPLEE